MQCMVFLLELHCSLRLVKGLSVLVFWDLQKDNGPVQNKFGGAVQIENTDVRDSRYLQGSG